MGQENRSASEDKHARDAVNIDRFVASVRKRYEFSDEEVRLVKERMSETQSFAPGDYLVREGERIGYSSLIIEGFACRCKDSADGERQIMEIQIPGDFVDLHSYPLEVLDHGICALSDCTIVKLHHSDISEIIDISPRIARILWFTTMVDASIHREWIMNIGSRSGKARIAHLLSELYCRSEVVGLTEDHNYRLPLNQSQIGECLGFTQIHVNRLMRELREDGLVTVQSQIVRIHDWEGLQKLAEFDPAYLYFRERVS